MRCMLHGDLNANAAGKAAFYALRFTEQSYMDTMLERTRHK